MLTFLASAAMMAASQPISGTARAGDGDSLTVGATRIRLFGIDAPELDQVCKRDGRAWSCGQAAAEQLSNLVAGQEVRCIPVGADQHDRVLARCVAGQVTSIGRWSQAGTPSPSAATRRATSARRRAPGLPGAACGRAPSRCRPRQGPRRALLPSLRRPGSARSGPLAKRLLRGGACRIKGNHSRRGEWIYHVPGMPYYEQTRPEAMFCTEAEARAAGYRRAIVK